MFFKKIPKFVFRSYNAMLCAVNGEVLEIEDAVEKGEGFFVDGDGVVVDINGIVKDAEI